jgi:hypothetical protein
MKLNIIDAQHKLPAKKGYAVSLIIKKLKGYKDVEVHLFLPEWDEKEALSYDWSKLLGDPIDSNAPPDPTGSRKVLMESFSLEERDIVLDYMKKRYVSRLSAINSRPMDFPIPMGLIPLGEIPEDDDIGCIRFEEIPNYNLPFPVHGLYILSQHEPVDQEI